MSNGAFRNLTPRSSPSSELLDHRRSFMSIRHRDHAPSKKHSIAPGTKCALILDSTPTPPTYTLTLRAFTAGLHGWLRKILAGRVLTVVYFLFRRPRPLTREIAGLNDPALLPWTSKATPRLYLYSTADVIVPASAVEEHAAHARMAGFPMEMVNFGWSAHVSHARDYPEKH
ncbi:hypothetical protein V8D89_003032 [Ganoderma adspersum]